MKGISERIGEYRSSGWLEGYKVGKERGRGTFGTVFEIVKDDGSEAKSALKVITITCEDAVSPERLRQEKEKFFNEIKALVKLKSHPNVVSYENHGSMEIRGLGAKVLGYDFLIKMELMPYELNEIMRDETLPLDEILKIGRDISKALAACSERHIIHRDIKPSCIFRSEFGDYKLGDFGEASLREGMNLAKTYRGSLGYMAPEVYRLKDKKYGMGRPYDARADIYSLGIVLYQLLNNGRFPLQGKDEDYIYDRLAGKSFGPPKNGDAALNNIIMKAVRFDPDERYHDAKEFNEAIRRYISIREDEKRRPSVHGKIKFTDPYDAHEIEEAGPLKNEHSGPRTIEANGEEAEKASGTRHYEPVVLKKDDGDNDFEYDVCGGYVHIKRYTGSRESITVPEKIGGYQVRAIGNYAFRNCGMLKSAIIPESIDSVGQGAFMGCTALNSVELPDGLTVIEKNMFLCCEKLESIAIPDSVTEIGDSAFWNCTGIECIDLPYGLRIAGEKVFWNCRKLFDITLPNSLEKIGSAAFMGCKSIRLIRLPDSLRELPDDLFWNCTSLTRVMLPTGVEKIGNNTFWNCDNLEWIVIPESVKYIGKDAFKWCDSLTLNCGSSTYIYRYAEENGINCKTV